MVATLIDGRTIAAQIRQEITERVIQFKTDRGYAPGLAVVLIGDNPASHVYVENKRKACNDVGIHSKIYALPETASQKEITSLIDALNVDDRVHGILIQLPLPLAIDTPAVIFQMAPHKDVDGLHPQNLGLMFAGTPSLMPCTPLGCLELIKSVVPSMKGKHVVIVGWSLLVGRPMALLLGFEDATVVTTHEYTKDLIKECRRADILVTAVGKPGLITAKHVKPGAVVIDIGITRVEAPDETISIKGDVVFGEVRQVAGFLTPVPGGVGPMTVAYLLKNTLMAAEMC